MKKTEASGAQKLLTEKQPQLFFILPALRHKTEFLLRCF